MLRNTTMSEATLMFMVGYFIYDLYVVIKYFSDDYGSLMHHICAIIQHLVICTNGVCAFVQMCFVLTEISTPFVNNRFFLVDSEMKESQGYKLNGIMMFLTFLIVRVPLIAFVPYLCIIKQDQFMSLHIALRCFFAFMFLVISSLNGLWFYKITMGIVKTLVPSKNKTK
jgi:hypothetical protein